MQELKLFVCLFVCLFVVVWGGSVLHAGRVGVGWGLIAWLVEG